MHELKENINIELLELQWTAFLYCRSIPASAVQKML